MIRGPIQHQVTASNRNSHGVEIKKPTVFISLQMGLQPDRICKKMNSRSGPTLLIHILSIHT